ncbi:hypothetical protein ACG93T_16995 [Acinetobacter beijerinckii]|uniref:hypothetical protein n=1 Tax=Acinetobacter beijerinckii TaxID=262668 RepID=UPI003AF4FDF1
MTASTVQLRLQIVGQQAQQQMQRLNLQQQQSQQQQRQNLNQILNIQQRINTSTQQGGRYGQQQLRTGQSMVQTNRLLAQMLQQQQRTSSLISQQLRQQERSYQVQVNALRQQVREAERLRQQLQQAGNAQRDINRNSSGGGQGLISGAAAVVGGAYAGGMVVSNVLKEPRNYMRQVSLATDTLVGSENISNQEFTNRMNKMDSFVRNAVIKGGSAPESVVPALNTLVASNVFKDGELEQVLLDISRTAFASGADANDVALMKISQRRFGLSNLTQADDMAFRAGQEGSFELRDMARYNPDLLTQGSRAGYKGEKGFQNLLTMMQISMRTAADPSQAATNLSDLLGSFSQYYFGLQIAKYITPQGDLPVSPYGLSKKKTGVDWVKYASKRQEQGVGQVDAAAELVSGEMMINPLYRKYQERASKAANEIANKKKQGLDASQDQLEYQTNLESAIEIVAQGEVGKIFHNKQQLAAFTALMLSKGSNDDYQTLFDKIGNADGAVDASHNRQAGQEYAADGSFDAATYFAKVDSYKDNAGWLGEAKQAIANWAAENQNMAGKMATTSTVLVGLAASAGIASLALRGGRTTPPIPPTGGSRASNVIKTAGVAAAGYLGFEAFKPLDDFFYGKIAGFFGASEDRPDFMQMAIDKSQEQKEVLEQQNQLIEKQNQLSVDMVNKLNSLISVTQQNKPVINMGGSLMDQISQHTRSEEKRHGVDLLSYGQK